MPGRWIPACLAALLGLAATAAAVVTATQGDSPASVVSRFFHAVADANAPLALGLAAQPAPGPFLTSTVLRQQQAVARLSDVRVGPVTATGPGRRVAQVRYRLSFATGPEQVADQVQLSSSGGRWRLVRVSASALIAVSGAPGRIMLAGRPLPATAQLFPGALPVAADWAGIAVTNRPHLRLADPQQSVVVSAAVTAAGRAELGAAVEVSLRRCLQVASDDPSCPAPTVSPDRPVPGSLHGQLVGPITPTVAIGAGGLLTVTGTATVRGSCRVWDYDNIASARTGEFAVAITGSASVADPTSVVFGRR